MRYLVPSILAMFLAASVASAEAPKTLIECRQQGLAPYGTTPAPEVFWLDYNEYFLSLAPLCDHIRIQFTDTEDGLSAKATYQFSCTKDWKTTHTPVQMTRNSDGSLSAAFKLVEQKNLISLTCKKITPEYAFIGNPMFAPRPFALAGAVTKDTADYFSGNANFNFAQVGSDSAFCIIGSVERAAADLNYLLGKNANVQLQGSDKVSFEAPLEICDSYINYGEGPVCDRYHPVPKAVTYTTCK